jgi:hypothetical protein
MNADTETISPNRTRGRVRRNPIDVKMDRRELLCFAI